MPKVVNRAEKQQAILDSAVDVIYEQGIEAVSIRQIARASGMGRSSIYTYFNNREDILHVALRQVLAAFEKLQISHFDLKHYLNPCLNRGFHRANLFLMIRKRWQLFFLH